MFILLAGALTFAIVATLTGFAAGWLLVKLVRAVQRKVKPNE